MAREKSELGSIRQRSANSWELRYRMDGENYIVRCKTKEECEKELKKLGLKLGRGEPHVRSDINLVDYMNDWLDNFGRNNLRASTYENYYNYFNHHVPTTTLGQMPLGAVGTRDLQDFFNEKAESGRRDGLKGGLSPKTLRNIRNAMNLVFKQALADELITRNPITGVRLPKDPKREMRVLTREEQRVIERMVKLSADRMDQGIILALYTGIRIGELLALTWDHVELNADAPYIIICQSLKRERTPFMHSQEYNNIISTSKSGKTSLTVGETKTTTSHRKIYLPKKAIDALTKMYKWHGEMEDTVGIGWNPGNFVITTITGDPMEARTYVDKLDRIVTAAHIPHVNFHALRHTYATRAIEWGMDIATLSRNLGHAQISTTLNMYVDCMDEQKRKSVKIFDDQPDLGESDDDEDEGFDFSVPVPVKPGPRFL